MAANNPYAADLGALDALTVLGDTPTQLAKLFDKWSPADFERTYAPHKWPVRQMLVHLLHLELAFSWRLRMALATEHYVVQPFDQDDWMAAEALVPAIEAWTAWRTLRTVNLRLVRELKPPQLGREFRHPDLGPWTVTTLIEWVAGHDRHHLPQFEQAAR